VLLPGLCRSLVLAPLAVFVAIAVAVLFPLLAVLTWIVGLRRRPGTSRNRPLRLLFFALVWLFADAAAVFMCLSLWIATGFGGRGATGPLQARPSPVTGLLLRPVYFAAPPAFDPPPQNPRPQPTRAALAPLPPDPP